MTFRTGIQIPLVSLALTLVSQAAPTLVKLHDFDNTDPLFNPQPQNPNDAAVLIGNKLWFTTEKGGNDDFGTLSTFDVDTWQVEMKLSLDNQTGNSPKASPTVDGDLLYFTTLRGGTGDRGTLSTWNMNTSSQQVLWNSPSSSPATNPNSLWGNVAIIDRGGTNGKDIYFLTQSGGVGSAYGTIQRYQTNDQSVTTVHEFQGAPDGKQPYKGFTVVGTDLYFTTFTGGLSGTGFTQGAGTLGRVDAAVRGGEVVTQLAAMPSGDGSQRFGGHNPYYRAADHSLYFTLVGTTTQSGALMKFDLNTHTLTTLHEIQDAATSSSYFPEGKLAYSAVAEWNHALYYATIQGGDHGGGTINRYHLQTGVHEVLFHLDSNHNDAETPENMGGEMRGGFTFNGSTTQPAFYILTRQGGDHDHGTVLKLGLDPAEGPTAYESWAATLGFASQADAAPNADPDHDGRSNKIEFAYGTSPLDGADGGGFTAVAGGSGLEIRWTARSDASVTYVVTGSPTLGQAPSPWTAVTGSQEILTTPDIAVPSGYERRSMTLPIDSSRGFFRVEATLSPTALP